MKILVFGAGGIGSVVGGFLARTGHEVSLLGRSWHLDAIRKNGLAITGIWGDYRIKAFDLYTDLETLKAAAVPFDLILVTVKSYDTAAAAAELPALMNENTMVLSLQNGLGNIEALLKTVKPENFLAGRAIFGVETDPGAAKVTVMADPVYIGALPGSKPKLSAERMAASLSAAKIPALPVGDIIASIWAKVIYNCALNPICTLEGIPYGKILESDAMRSRMREVVRECYAVGRARGIALDPATAGEYIELLETRLIPKTAAHYPSMLQDKRRGKRTEIDSLSGAIARLGRECGVPAPVNEALAGAL